MLSISQKITFISYFFLLSCFILGCAQTPDEVKEDIAKINASKKEIKEYNESIIYKNVSQLKTDAKEDYSKDMGVLTFRGDVIIPDCKNVYLLEMKLNDEIYNNLESNMPLFLNFAGMESNNWENYIIAEKGISDKLLINNVLNNNIEDKTYSNRGYCFVEYSDLHISVNHSGWISINNYLNSDKHPYFLKIDGKIVDTYYFINDKEKKLNKEIELNNEKITLREIDDSFEKAVSLINACSSGLNLILHDARVVEEKETGTRMVVFRALNNYEGVYFDSNYITPQNSQITEGKSFVGYEMNQQIHTVGDKCNVALRESSYIVSKEIKKYSKVIDFDYALHMVEKTIPQDKITTLESAEFLYQIFYEGEEGQGWQYVYENPPSFYAAPVWKFIEKDRPNEMKATVYYVDAISGEVYSFYKACTP